jgi:hypothetical protein
MREGGELHRSTRARMPGGLTLTLALALALTFTALAAHSDFFLSGTRCGGAVGGARVEDDGREGGAQLDRLRMAHVQVQLEDGVWPLQQNGCGIGNRQHALQFGQLRCHPSETPPAPPIR